MKVTYKIYKVDSINVDSETHIGDYGYGSTTIHPTVLRSLYQPNFGDKDTFDTLVEAERYLENNLIEEYGDTYTILKEYNYEK